jgi:putative transposase
MKRAHHHAQYSLKYHLVLVTKYRRKAFTEEILQRLKIISQELLNKWDCELDEFGGEADHVHLLISAHPSLELSKLINSLKTITSRAIRKEFAEHLKAFYWKPVLWTRAYYIASAGGAPLEVIKQYIENQGKEKD